MTSRGAAAALPCGRGADGAGARPLGMLAGCLAAEHGVPPSIQPARAAAGRRQGSLHQAIERGEIDSFIGVVLWRAHVLAVIHADDGASKPVVAKVGEPAAGSRAALAGRVRRGAAANSTRACQNATPGAAHGGRRRRRAAAVGAPQAGWDAGGQVQRAAEAGPRCQKLAGSKLRERQQQQAVAAAAAPTSPPVCRLPGAWPPPACRAARGAVAPSSCAALGASGARSKRVAPDSPCGALQRAAAAASAIGVSAERRPRPHSDMGMEIGRVCNGAGIAAQRGALTVAICGLETA